MTQFVWLTAGQGPKRDWINERDGESVLRGIEEKTLVPTTGGALAKRFDITLAYVRQEWNAGRETALNTTLMEIIFQTNPRTSYARCDSLYTKEYALPVWEMMISPGSITETVQRTLDKMERWHYGDEAKILEHADDRPRPYK